MNMFFDYAKKLRELDEVTKEYKQMIKTLREKEHKLDVLINEYEAIRRNKKSKR